MVGFAVVFVVQHADGEVHFFADFFRRGGDGVEARRQRAQQRQQLFAADSCRVAGDDGVYRRGGGEGGGAGRGDGAIQHGVLRERGVALDEAGGVLRDFALMDEDVAQWLARDGRRAVQFEGGEDAINTRRVVFAPDAERVARLVVEAGAGEVQLDVAHVFRGMAPGDFCRASSGALKGWSRSYTAAAAGAAAVGA